ncbi:MAG: FMN-binding negative transcriptional regulator [Alphaproteobacteria bacterium]
MYVHPAFKVHPAAALAFAAARGFGTVVACDVGRPVAAHLPFRLIEQDGKVPKLEFHVARANPLGSIAEKGGTWLVAVQGHDAYVSPDWYASAEQVPTWLYESVHLSGPVRVIPGEHTRPHTEALSAKFEGWIDGKQPWLIDKVSDKRREMLLKGIVAVEMTVETVEGNFKLNQHKADEDHVAVAIALAAQDDPSSQAIAKRMVALRPHLDYLPQRPVNPALTGIAAK